MMITPERGHTVARTTSEARKSLPELIDWVNRPEGRVILTRHGRRVAALVSLPDLERILSETEMEDTIAAIKTGDRRRLSRTSC